MNRKIKDLNGARYVKALETAASDPRVDEIEGGGCEAGRVFIHLKPGFWYRGYDCGSKTVGSTADVRSLMTLIERRVR